MDSKEKKCGFVESEHVFGVFPVMISRFGGKPKKQKPALAGFLGFYTKRFDIYRN
jgi:hypothetical protein